MTVQVEQTVNVMESLYQQAFASLMNNTHQALTNISACNPAVDTDPPRPVAVDLPAAMQINQPKIKK